MSGETASFLAGGEFPVPVPQSADTITIEWKQYGVSLAFTPTIINDSRINLHVRPEVSQLSDSGAITLNNIVVPALTTRRAETTLELNSGQSFALAGLLNNQQTQAVSKFPFLGDMPILGPLFRSTRFQNNESELVIIITPYIVKPTTQEHLALPTDGFAPPTDDDFIFRMRQTNSDPNARPISGEPRAVLKENPLAEDSLQPAPVSTVTVVPTKTAETPTLNKSAPMSKPAALSKLKKMAPAGPGGFIVE
jgi:pilus assembly protein CpaC